MKNLDYQQQNFVRRLISVFLAVIICVSVMSGAVFASGNQEKTVTISLSGDEFYFAPETLTVSSDLAYQYGYENEDDGQVSILDALIAVHKILLSDGFTVNTAKDYLDINSGFITKILGVDASASSFFVNGVQPNDGVINPLYGSYTGYTADKSYLKDNDDVRIFLYQDKSFWSDVFSWFDKTNVTAAPNQEVNLNLSGYVSFFGCYPQETIEANTEAISDIKILSGTDKYDLKDTGIVTDNNGNFTLSFETPGKYFISAESYSDDFTYIVLPWCEVTVEEENAETASPSPTEAPVVVSASPLPTDVPYEETFTPAPTETSNIESASPLPTSSSVPDTVINKEIKLLMSNISSLYTETTEAWSIFDMVCGGYSSKLKNKSEAKQLIIDDAFTSQSIGTLAKDGFALKSIGTDIKKLKSSDGEVFDLIDKISSYNISDITYITDAVFAMLLYDSGDYTVNGNLTREALIEYILTSRNSDGVWGYTWEGMNYPDYDSSAMVLNALSKYYLANSAESVGIDTKTHSQIKTAVDKIVNILSEKIGTPPKREPGIIRRMNEEYFRRIEAIEFAVKYDDGKDPRGVLKADLVLVGISRTSKTPLSMYLANRNIKVANIPLVPEIPIPKEVYEINPKKIIGLTNTPEKLNEIRQSRLKALGLSSSANYAKFDRILEELDYAEKVMKKIGCPVINVSDKAIEETASDILDIMKEKGIHKKTHKDA